VPLATWEKFLKKLVTFEKPGNVSVIALLNSFQFAMIAPKMTAKAPIPVEINAALNEPKALTTWSFITEPKFLNDSMLEVNRDWRK